MDRLGEIRQLWRDRFNDSRSWMAEVFPRVYRDEDALTVTLDGHVASSMILRRERLVYQDIPLGMAYVYGAATARRLQGRGYMSALMVNAIRLARQRGDAVISLIPARGRLCNFYRRFGFVNSFYAQSHRYTARHIFPVDNDAFIIEENSCDPAELAKAYTRLSAPRQAFVAHNANDFKTILTDNAIDNGLAVVARSADNGDIRAIGFATAVDSEIHVSDIVADSHEAESAVLSTFSRHWPGKLMIVNAFPSIPGIKLRPRGMARIVNVEAMLAAVAKLSPQLHYTVNVSDPIIPENNGIFIIADGNVKHVDSHPGHTDLDVDISVLTSILFSVPDIGAVFNLPTARPFISLMLS